jgi:hypothetical protein
VAHSKGEPLLIWRTKNHFICLIKLKVMNIFYINEDPIIAARELADDHIRKMQIESAQMCCTAHWAIGGEAPYKRAHLNHPSTKWVRESIQHYRWLIAHGLEICNEFEKRYGKSHKTKEVLEWCIKHDHICKKISKNATEWMQQFLDHDNELKLHNLITEWYINNIKFIDDEYIIDDSDKLKFFNLDFF